MAEKTYVIKKKVKKKKKNKKLRGLLVCLVFLFVIYLIGFLYFQDHFLPNTFMDDEEYSYLTVQDAQDKMASEISEYELELTEDGRTTGKIVGTDIELEWERDGSFLKAMDDQKKVFWFTSFFSDHEISCEFNMKYNGKKLRSVIKKLDIITDESRTEATDASITFSGSTYIIQNEEVGTKIDVDDLFRAVKQEILTYSASYEVSELYEQPEITRDNPDLTEAKDTLTEYIASDITYTFGDKSENLSKKNQSLFYTIKDDFSIEINEDAVREYVTDLAADWDQEADYDTDGYTISIEEETAQLMEDIVSGDTIEREPIHTTTEATGGYEYDDEDSDDKNSSDVNEHIEVSLSDQILIYVKDGQTVFSCYVVTGNAFEGNGTPKGTYTTSKGSTYCALDGQKSYMIRFGSYAIHENTERTYFGGTEYYNNGTKGCIDLASNDMLALYNMAKDNIKVIIY